MKDKTAIVTASSRGIGREIALHLAKSGARLLVNYKSNKDAAQEVVHSVQNLGGEAILLQADVSQADEAKNLVQACIQQWGRVDILVNNAGPFLMKTVAETTLEEWHSMINGNLHSAFYCTKEVLPVMRRQKSGHLIFIGAIKADSMRSRHNSAAYSIAKTGTLLLAKTIAREEGMNGIRANVINPGLIDTGYNIMPGEAEQVTPQVPLKRLGHPADIAQAVLLLLSPQASYINGATLNVDGGLWL